jgi:hypothetical protein
VWDWSIAEMRAVIYARGVSEIIIRNPTARWVFWLVWGAAILVFAWAAPSLTEPCMSYSYEACEPADLVTLGLIATPFYLGFFVAAWAAYRARVMFTDEGMCTKGFFHNKMYPWEQIREVRVMTVKRYANSIRVGTERRVDIYAGNRWIELPAPRAGTFFGKQVFEEQASLLWRTWRTRLELRRVQ